MPLSRTLGLAGEACAVEFRYKGVGGTTKVFRRTLGGDVAQRYLNDLRGVARQLSVHPFRAKPLKSPFRISRIRSHYLILHVDAAADRLTIARILHVGMDIERHLS